MAAVKVEGKDTLAALGAFLFGDSGVPFMDTPESVHEILMMKLEHEKSVCLCGKGPREWTPDSAEFPPDITHPAIIHFRCPCDRVIALSLT